MKFKKSYIIPLLVVSGFVSSCDDLFEPAIENNQSLSDMYTNPKEAQGLIGQVYTMINNVYLTTPQSDMATDDAVSNAISSTWKTMATGGWRAEMNPVSTWNACYAGIHYCNLFLDNADQIVWSESDPEINKMFNTRFKAEAYAYRAIFHFKALEAHAGIVGGTLVGIPIHDKTEIEGNYLQTRASIKECVNFILKDFDEALKTIPYQFADANSADDIPESLIPYIKKNTDGTPNVSAYNRVYGVQNVGKIDGKIIGAIKSQLELLCASPAYQGADTGIDWEVAAKDAFKVLKDAGKNPATLSPTGYYWYDCTTGSDNLDGDGGFKPATGTHTELLWHNYDAGVSNSLELNCYPPSLYGNGNINPTQNLVDAFPMANGYPITDKDNSGYDPENPFEGRDPRLQRYIVYNGNVIGSTNKTISVVMPGVGQTNIDANNQENGLSTKTGYYLKKLLRSNINLDPAARNTMRHLGARIRYTEIFLNYAEAANEVVGPKGLVGDADFSAYDVIKAIRSRGGITDEAYLDECAGDKEKFRELIHNERRLELCFENHRFWDLRRWNVGLSQLNQTAQGVTITENPDQTLNYTIGDVETRNYQSHQYFGPIPYSECLKFSELTQNSGW